MTYASDIGKRLRAESARKLQDLQDEAMEAKRMSQNPETRAYLMDPTEWPSEPLERSLLRGWQRQVLMWETAVRHGVSWGEFVELAEKERNAHAIKELRAALESPSKGSSWEPADLTDLTEEPLEPQWWRREDGVALLCPGRTHSLAGESGSGKSWVAQSVAAEVLVDGGRVCYLDFESDARGVRSRLRTLGVTEKALGRFTYVNPEGAPEGEAFEALVAKDFDFVVVDGVTAALASSGIVGDPLSNNNDAVTRWHLALPERFAKAGAAVLTVDHVVKAESAPVLRRSYSG